MLKQVETFDIWYGIKILNWDLPDTNHFFLELSRSKLIRFVGISLRNLLIKKGWDILWEIKILLSETRMKLKRQSKLRFLPMYSRLT
jgi:hypothetical protein